MKETVAIIGAGGKVGSAIALGFAAGGYRVLLADEIEKHPLLYIKLPVLKWKIRLKHANADVDMVLSQREASWEADVILLAIPYKTQAEVAHKIKDVVMGKIVVNMADLLNGADDELLAPPKIGAAEELAQHLPYSKIVNASTLIFEPEFKARQVSAQPVDMYVAGDDEEAVSTVKQLFNDAGFNPLCAGKLVKSRVLESLMTLLMGLQV